MAKLKRKPSEAQRNKNSIEIAKYLKKVGALSKQTNLHGGRYISKGVLKKVRELEFMASNRYKAAKVSKSYLEKAREQGYQIVNNRVIVPTTRDVQKRLDAGLVVGVIPVKGGHIESVVTPYDNLASLMRAMQNGELDRLKLPEEQFMFSLYGNMSYGGLRDSEHLAEYLRRYDSAIDALNGRPEDMTEYVRNLTIFRINRTDVTRYANRGENRGKTKSKKRRYADREKRLEQMGQIANERRLKQRALNQANYRAKLSPEKVAAQKEANRLREKARRDAQKK